MNAHTILQCSIISLRLGCTKFGVFTAASGEAFQKLGKIDIKIARDNRAAFITECKVWRVASELSKAINQHPSYLTWRDCKASVIIFNKHNKQFTELLEKTPEILKSYPRFKKHVKDEGE
jgi:hypothetical protein